MAVWPAMASILAVTVVEPTAVAENTPAGETLPTDGFELDHEAVAVTSLVEPSLNVSTAPSGWDVPLGSEPTTELTATLTVMAFEGTAQERLARLDVAFKGRNGKPLDRVRLRFEDGTLKVLP